MPKNAYRKEVYVEERMSCREREFKKGDGGYESSEPEEITGSSDDSVPRSCRPKHLSMFVEMVFLRSRRNDDGFYRHDDPIYSEYRNQINDDEITDLVTERRMKKRAISQSK